MTIMMDVVTTTIITKSSESSNVRCVVRRNGRQLQQQHSRCCCCSNCSTTTTTTMMMYPNYQIRRKSLFLFPINSRRVLLLLLPILLQLLLSSSLTRTIPNTAAAFRSIPSNRISSSSSSGTPHQYGSTNNNKSMTRTTSSKKNQSILQQQQRKNSINRSLIKLFQQQQQQQKDVVEELDTDKKEVSLPSGSKSTTRTTHGFQQQQLVDENGYQSLSSSSVFSSKVVVVVSAVTLLSLCIIGAIVGIIPGYYNINTNELNTIMLLQDVGSTILSGVLAYIFVYMNTKAVQMGKIESRDSRKFIHTLSAPLFMLLYPIFSSATGVRIFVASVPLLNAIRLYIASTSKDSTESDLAQAISRSGNINEAIGGPMIYVIMLCTAILCFWNTVPHGIIAISTLAAGDGMADLIGRRYGHTNQWSHVPIIGTILPKKKSIIGTIAFIISSFLSSSLLVLWMQYTNCMTVSYSTIDILINVGIISIIASIFELVPWLGDDNYTVPISAAILSMILFTS